MKKTLACFAILAAAFFLAPKNASAASLRSYFVKTQVCYNSQRLLGYNVERSVTYLSGNYRIRARIQNSDTKAQYVRIYIWTAGDMLEEVGTGVVLGDYFVKPASYVDINYTTQGLVIGNGISLKLYTSSVQIPNSSRRAYMMSDSFGLGYKNIPACIK